MPNVNVSVQPTQVARPNRTTFRTAIQAGIPIVIAFGLVAPEVVSIILEESGDSLPEGVRAALLGISAGAVAVAVIITRIMAIPRVEVFFKDFLPWLAADPDVVPGEVVVVSEDPEDAHLDDDTPPDDDFDGFGSFDR